MPLYRDRQIGKGYIFVQTGIAGVVAARNHLALFNPASSGITVELSALRISKYAVGDIDGTASPITTSRASSISGGTLQAASAIMRAETGMPNATAEVRTAGPSATLGAAFAASPPILAAAKTSSPYVHDAIVGVPGYNHIILKEGEGIVVRTSAGDVDQRWNIAVAWLEIDGA